MLNQFTPGIYTIQYHKESDTYSLELTQEGFKLPPVLYGNVRKNATRVWNTFSISKLSTGILLTGESGSGKSLLAEVICNMAISKGIPVIYITAIKMTSNLVMQLQRLTDVVIYMDEFGKCSDRDIQNTMLSFFSDTTTRKLFILTENNTWMVSNFILNRPGRIRYHIDYSKIPKNIVADYLSKNCKDETFKNDVFKLYLSSKTFSFDHLQTLVSEHDRYPEDDLSQLLEILNLGILAKPYVIYVKSVKNLDTNEMLDRSLFEYNEKYSFEDWVENSYNIFIVNIYKTGENFNQSQPGLPQQKENKFLAGVIKMQYKECECNENDYIHTGDGYECVVTKTRDPEAFKNVESTGVTDSGIW